MSEYIMDTTYYEKTVEECKNEGQVLINLCLDLNTMFSIHPVCKIVRCQDCMHFVEGEPSGVVVGGRTPDWCSLVDYPTHDEGFCHRGIKRIGGKDE